MVKKIGKDNTLIRVYEVTVQRSHTLTEPENILVLAYSVGQLDMLIKEHFGETNHEVIDIQLQQRFDKVITPQIR